ncbi:hypothetical protein [Pseudoalteromonas galatheae]|uniref:hypothetical protein n=1 Tax=Pseudoalteromonas galatheae TaxID=579562 RepID=UPI0030CF679B
MKDLFESRLIDHLADQSDVGGDYDKLAAILTAYTGKNVSGRSIVFMSRGACFAKKWLLMALFELSLKSGWMPSSIADWENVIWTLTGKKQSVLGGDNTKIFEQLADISNKPELVFENNFNKQVK